MHAAVTDGVFLPGPHGPDGPPAFLPALEPPPISPARGPPTEWGELVQVHDDRDVFQGQIDELPATTGPARTRQRPD